MKNIAFLILSAFFLLSCDSGKNDAYSTRIFNSSVASSLIKADKELKKVRTELSFQSGVKVNNCAEYNKAIKQSKISEGVNNQLVKSEYLICDALRFLDGKADSVAIVKAKNKLFDILSTQLDLRTFRSSLGPRLDDKNYTLKSIAGSNLKFKDNYVIYETSDWHYKIEMIAVTDVNNNKKDDWILWLTDESKNGNYRGYHTLLLHDVDVSNDLKVSLSY